MCERERSRFKTILDEEQHYSDKMLKCCWIDEKIILDIVEINQGMLWANAIVTAIVPPGLSFKVSHTCC